VIELGPNRYGKAAIRLVRVARGRDGHVVRDLTVALALEGDFDAAHTEGDNANVIATDTMKNTVYAFAADHLDGSIERFGLALASHFGGSDQVDRATVSIREHDWRPIPMAASAAPDAFVRSGELTRLAIASASRVGTTIEAGIEDLTVMKSTRSSFTGFPRDRYTTLPETSDRIMATKIAAVWSYGGAQASDSKGELDYDAEFGAIRDTLLEVFADHDSPSVQATIWIMGRAVLERHDSVDEIRMTMPNLHHWTVDLSPFGLENPNEIFVPTTEPYGLIEATVRRTS
jgi:urate oxidase